ncbi:hypothetical protein [Halolamina salifodinae]|uniref:TolA-binding protein n=1 Tax=Halolamina salifodinae TaxID=1202767 RepID=A0A8T4GVP0_9EURY|nr:hypothetical protein [Halolamina salifodinae]MBP1986976.1 TolA-binding protein [Halolamina salifodinae]
MATNDEAVSVSVSMPQSEYERADEIADQMGISTSKCIREGHHLQPGGLEEQISQLEDTIESLANEIEEKQSKLDAKRARLEHLKKKLEEREEEEEEDEARLQSAINRIASYFALDPNQEQLNFDKLTESDVETIIRLDDEVTTVEEVYDMARSRADEVEPTDYLDDEFVRLNGGDESNDLTENLDL